ncbi:methylaspartate mutase subunit E [Nocardia sp. NPDC004750]
MIFLGAQNDSAEVCRRALKADAALISNMDGHAAYYLDTLRNDQTEFGVSDRLWYLGGYPSLDDDKATIQTLHELGFDRVFHGYTDTDIVIEILSKDLEKRSPIGQSCHGHMGADVSTSRLPTRRLLPQALTPETREEVLASWASGSAANDLYLNASRLAAHAKLSDTQALAQQRNEILIQPRSGVSDHDNQRDLFAKLDRADADVLSFQIDSLTRNNRYDDIQRILKDPNLPHRNSSLLNGYPAVNHGVDALAALADQFQQTPLQVRHSTRDPRLLAEISFAAGISAFEGGPISYNLPYFRNYPIHEALELWKYVDELAGYYKTEHAIAIDREFFGVLTACLVPPSIAVVVNIFEALLAAECGVKAVSLGYAEQGHRAQDLAAVRVLRNLAQRYLSERGHADVVVNVVWHQYMGPFPRSRTKARQLLQGSATSAAASEAVRLMLKTEVEGQRIPTAEDNCVSLAMVKEICRYERLKPRPALSESDRFEEDLITAEARAILDKSLLAASGRTAQAVQMAITQGWLDVPFSPSIWNANCALPIRDCEGAIRFADIGNLPLPVDVVEFHRSAVSRRRRRNSNDIHQMIETDINCTANGAFETWPLG